MPQIFVPKRFNGPPDTANGGYVAGLIAGEMRKAGMGGTIEVSLRAPPPVEAAMDLVIADGACECRHGERVVGAARRVEPLGAVPAAPSLDMASRGRDNFPPVADHAFPYCFVCGPSRTHDGLCIFTGRPHGYDGVTDVWTPDADYADDSGRVHEEVLWAALDCPGAFAIGFQERPMVLGRIRGEVLRRPEAGAPLIVAAWHLYDDGRKHGAASALFTANGELLAQTEQLWIELK